MSLLKNLKEYLSDERGSYLYAILDSAIESRVKEYIEPYLSTQQKIKIKE